MSDIYKLKLEEIGKSLASAVFAAAVFGFGTVLSGVFGAPNFDLFSVNWIEVLRQATNVGFTAAYTAFVGTVSGYFVRDKNGAYFGKFGGIKPKEE